MWRLDTTHSRALQGGSSLNYIRDSEDADGGGNKPSQYDEAF